MNNDEKYCFSCGGIIKKEAEICPKCGVNQLKKSTTSALEIYCFSCGALIKKEAEICPKCGVRQINQTTQTGQLISENGNVKRINKHFFVWVCTFLFGYLGVDRFLRGQIAFGVLKLLLDCFAIWALIDWIIALTKYNVAGEDFTFIDGKWA
jgi:RNA polymerase subunit RPABC4/transcription elongation factor Spt4